MKGTLVHWNADVTLTNNSALSRQGRRLVASMSDIVSDPELWTIL
jgi:hypothetical protein